MEREDKKNGCCDDPTAQKYEQETANRSHSVLQSSIMWRVLEHSKSLGETRVPGIILVITTAIAQKAEDAFTHITRPGPNEQPLTGFRQTRATTTRDVFKTRLRL